MQGISTKVTAATLATAVLTIVNWVTFDKFGVPAPPDTVMNAISVLTIFGSGYLVREKAPNV